MNMITSTLLAAGFSLLAGSAAAQTCVAQLCRAWFYQIGKQL